MDRTRTVLTVLLAAAAAAAFLLGAASVASADQPTNRGWSTLAPHAGDRPGNG